MAASTLTTGFIKKFPAKPGKPDEIRQHSAEASVPSPHARIPGEAMDPAIEGPSKEDLEILEVWHQYRANPDRQDLRNRLVERYMPLVRYNGERIWARLPEGVELDDLVSAGIFGLMDAIDAFDLNRGVKFET